MRANSLVRYGVIAVLIIVAYQLLKQISPLTVLIFVGIYFYSKGY